MNKNIENFVSSLDIKYLDKIFENNFINKKNIIGKLIKILENYDKTKLDTSSMIDILEKYLINKTYKFDYNYISGAVNVYFLSSKKHNKNILMFSDIHHLEDFCKPPRKYIKLPKFINDILKYSDSFIDLYVELGWRFSISEINFFQKQALNQNLAAVIHMLRKCYPLQLNYYEESFFDVFDPGKCPYKNIRAHLGDARMETPTPDIFPKMKRKLDKELSKIPLNLKEKIEDSFVEPKTKNMDKYLMSRIFKKYEVKKSGKIHPECAKNIIICAGCKHIENYAKFLTTELDFKLEYYQGINSQKYLKEVLPFFRSLDFKKGMEIINKNGKEYQCVKITPKFRELLKSYFYIS